MSYQPGADDPEDFKRFVREELTRLGKLLKNADQMMMDHERTLYGHEDSRRREVEPGLVTVVAELASAFKEVRAVAKAGWALLGLVGVSTLVSLYAIFSGGPS